MGILFQMIRIAPAELVSVERMILHYSDRPDEPAPAELVSVERVIVRPAKWVNHALHRDKLSGGAGAFGLPW